MSVAQDPPAGGQHGLHLEAIFKRSNFTLDVNFHLPGRGVSALFGASGSGKTTCLRILAGLEPEAKGRLCVAGELWQDSARRLFRPAHQRAIGYVFQEPSLFAHLTVEGNLKYGFKRVRSVDRRHGWDQALHLLGIEGLMARWPHELSGGERQRVAISRALASSPALLLMDEPLASLDGPRKAEVLPYLERLHSELDIPVVYVSHAPDEVARLADHLVLLDAGRVIASGPTRELMTRLDLPLAHGDSAAALLEAVVDRLEPEFHLVHVGFPGGRLCLLNGALRLGQRVRVRIQARDVSITLSAQHGTSIQNILPATVVELSPDVPGQLMVSLAAGPSTLLARISHKSAASLCLAPGSQVFAQIKSVAVVG